jgi:diguanylate cyclase (GGDEF)-like protein
VKVRFWGTRGSIASPGPRTAKYGGNTSCVEVRSPGGTLVVLDCGTGIRELGLHLMRTEKQPLRVHLFIGHTHWDHIQGFPFFVPAFIPGAELNIYAPIGFQRSLEEAMSGQMEYSYFPVKLRDLRSRIHYTELEEGFFRVNDVLVETQYLNHTAPTIAYRLTIGGASVVYATDHEPFWGVADGLSRHPGDERHVAFLRDVDLLIHDAQYTAEEYQTKIGWGHSSIEYVIDVAVAANVGQLALFHHDPLHDDEMVARLEEDARARVKAKGAATEVFAAVEGMTLDVVGRGTARAVAEGSALQRHPIAGGRVLVVSAHREDVGSIEEVLAEDGLVLVPANDMQSALARVPEVFPDLAIIDAKLPDGDGGTLVRSLRERKDLKRFPILLLTPSPETMVALEGPHAPDDYLAKPFSPPMLHSRVRAWLARTLDAEESLVERSAGAIERSAVDASSASLLTSLPLFRPLTDEQLHELMVEATDQYYAPGQAVVGQGEIADLVFVVLSGRVRVVEALPDLHAEAFLGELGPGEIFGEMGILTDRPRSATVVAIERTRCVAVRQRNFLQALRCCPDMAEVLMRLLAGRLYDADRRLARYAPDALTGLSSRRAFHDLYQRLAAGARRRGRGVLLITLDVVHLKEVNDQFGYGLGDEILRTIADALMEDTRTTDLVARYGGDEFVVLLLDAERKDAELVIPRVGSRLAALVRDRRLPMPVQCAVGIAHRRVPPESAEDLVREADQDLRRVRRRVP